MFNKISITLVLVAILLSGSVFARPLSYEETKECLKLKHEYDQLKIMIEKGQKKYNAGYVYDEKFVDELNSALKRYNELVDIIPKDCEGKRTTQEFVDRAKRELNIK